MSREPAVALDELLAIARAVAIDDSLEVIAGKRGGGWFIDLRTGIIHCDAADLERQAADDSRGLVCHEAAHAAVTRYPWIVPDGIRRRPGLPSLLNALEDCRIEAWLARRFPGVGPWIDLYNDRLFPDRGQDLREFPFFQQFCLGSIREWWQERDERRVADPVRAALDATREARRRFVEAQPPTSPDVPWAMVRAYDEGPLPKRFAALDRAAVPDGFEKAVRSAAWQAWRVVWLDIRPAYEALLDKDPDGKAQLTEAERRFLSQTSGIVDPSAPRRGRRPAGLAPGELPVGPPVSGPLPPGGTVTELSPEERAALDAAVAADPADRWAEALREVEPLVERLAGDLERVLRPVSYPRWLSGYASGARVDLRVAMSAEIQPGAYTRMWQRKTLPDKRDPAFWLLLDLSGSMSGANIEHGFKGVVLLASVLDRLGIPFAVSGFQDVVIPFKEMSDPLDPLVKKRLGTMPLEVSRSRPGGRNRPEHNWDGPVLKDIAERLSDWPAATPILVVVSDGVPSGPSDGERALHQAVATVLSSGITLLGIGLGPGTGHVARYYPDAIADVPLQSFAAALGARVDQLLRGAGRRRPI